MKTAMQKLIDYIEKNETIRNPDTDLLTPLSSVDIHRKAMELLEIEKTNIIDACDYGIELNQDTPFTGEEYYERRFR